MANYIKRINFNAIGGATNAASVSYDNSTSGLAAENVQDAIDETVIIAEDAQADATQAQAEVDALEVSVNDLDSRLTTAEADIDSLQAADVALDTRLDIAEADILTAQSTANSAQTDATSALSNIANHIADTSDAHDASAISVAPVGTISSTDVQAAINEIQGDASALSTRVGTAESEIDTLQADVIAAQSAADQAQADADTALLQSADAQQDISDHISDTTGAHAASAISNTPAGTISATTVQAAINELNGDVINAQTDATQALSDAASAQATASQAQTEVDVLEGVVATLNSVVTALDTRVDTLETYNYTEDIPYKTFSISNNTAVPASITGFSFSSARSFSALVSVVVDATADLFQEVSITGTKKASTWVISYNGTGDISGVEFDITNAGQLTYICPNYSGFVSGQINFRAIAVG